MSNATYFSATFLNDFVELVFLVNIDVTPKEIKSKNT